jgi:TM2 domain-containing membrane protein YozV
MLVHEPKRKKTVFLLCLFLGWLGCHRYYIGKRGTGRLYLLTGGFLLIGVVMDLVLILTDSLEDRFGQPLV